MIITKEKDTFCISDPVNKIYISNHSFVYSEIGVNKPQAFRRIKRTRQMQALEEEETKKESDEMGEVIKGKSNIDNAVGIFNDRVKALFHRILFDLPKSRDGNIC